MKNKIEQKVDNGKCFFNIEMDVHQISALITLLGGIQQGEKTRAGIKTLVQKKALSDLYHSLEDTFNNIRRRDI